MSYVSPVAKMMMMIKATRLEPRLYWSTVAGHRAVTAENHLPRPPASQSVTG